MQASVADRFRLVRELGRGANGVVHLAHDDKLDRDVALKLLYPVPNVPAAERLLEAELIGAVEHPNIVRILGAGVTFEDAPWVCMEWLEGEVLEQRQHRDPLPIVKSLRLASCVARGLQAAHERGVIHRDVKPANIFLTYPEGEGAPLPKILDFGAALRIDTRRLSEHGIVGTPAYMAPEQVRGDTDVGVRSDLYALGATLYELICGQPPHRGPTHLATLARLATTRPRRLVEFRHDVPQSLDDYLQSLLATDPAERPDDAGQVAERLLELASSIARGSISDAEPRSSRLGSSASRILTTVVALDFPSSAARDQAISGLVARNADAVPLAGDSLVSHLGARRAQGNEAVAALRLGQRLSREGARVGVATGRAFVPMADLETRWRPVGEVVDRAISLAKEASARQVIADATTSELARGRYDFAIRPDGSAITRGSLSNIRTESAGGTPFVGRDAEIGQLKAAFDGALSESRALVVSLVGPPGIGKTRLQREAVARLLPREQVKHFVYQRSEAYGQRRALGAAADIVRTLLELPKGVDDASCHGAFCARVRADTPVEHTRLLARLISNRPLEPGEAARHHRDVLWLMMTQVVETSAEQGPTLLVVEDMQWADPESVGWLEHVTGRLQALPLLLLLTSRPAFWQQQPDRFNQVTHLKIQLHPISDNATRAIAHALLGDKLNERTFERIVTQSGGLPLFAEELSRLLAAGRSVELAPTIEAAIQASLDALASEQRDAIGRLSVLGLAGWDDGLEALGIDDPERVLTELSAHEILVEQDTSRFFGLREWHFKHALVRDVAYHSLGEEERGELHALAADWLETVGEDAAVVAGHFELAKQPERAAAHWAQAARRALGTSSLTDALAMAEKALAFADDPRTAFERARILDEAWSRHDARASDRESAVLALEDNVYDEASRVYAQGARARYDAARGQGYDVNERLAQVRERAHELSLNDEEARASAALAQRLAFAGQFEEAEQEAARLLALGKEPGMGAAAVDGWQTLAIVHQSRGAVADALSARRNAAQAAKQADLTERESMLTTNLGFALSTIGARKEAREHLDRGLSLAQAIGSVGARRHALMILLCWSSVFGSERSLDAVLAEVREDADAVAHGMWTAPARENLGIIYYRALELLRAGSARSVERARKLLEIVVEAYRQTENRDVLPAALGMWARAELASGDVDAAKRLAEQAGDLLRSGAPSLLNESPVYLVLHDVHTLRGEPELAKKAIEEGIQPLLRRLSGLLSTSYVRPFLTELVDNAALVSHAERYGLLPDRVRKLIESDSG
jgi:tetratricopeptide (TPR) repeat protein